VDTTYLTAEEAAQRLRVSPDTIRRFLRDKKLDGARVGGQWRIPVEALQQVYAPTGEILEEKVMTLTDREVAGVTIPAATLAYVAAHHRGCEGDSITVRETPPWLSPLANRLPDFELHLAEQNQTWKFVPNDGVSRSLAVPRAVLRELRALINSAYVATTAEDRNTNLERAYMSIRTVLGLSDLSDEDTIPKAVEARAGAMFKPPTIR
jgi:excisionase family DNA binding protein